MGQAKNKRLHQEASTQQLQQPVSAVSHALRRLTLAASSNLGSDCYLLAILGQKLLADQGIQAQIHAGYSSWRVGGGDGDVIAHIPNVPAYKPEDVASTAYHAWLVLPESDLLLDLTTYQLPVKGQKLDAMDGGKTSVDWAPDFLLAPLASIKTHSEVARAAGPVAYNYQAVPGLLTLLESGSSLDEGDLAVARLLVANPVMEVVGPNSGLS